MNTVMIEINKAKAKKITLSDDTIIIDLEDGRTISAPIAWYPRLLYGTKKERNNWRLIGDGEGIHWPDLDEDISIDNIIFGKSSGESQQSFKKWLDNRNKNIKERKTKDTTL